MKFAGLTFISSEAGLGEMVWNGWEIILSIVHKPGNAITIHVLGLMWFNVRTGGCGGLRWRWRGSIGRQRRFFQPAQAWHPSTNRISGIQEPATRTFGPPVRLFLRPSLAPRRSFYTASRFVRRLFEHLGSGSLPADSSNEQTVYAIPTHTLPRARTMTTTLSARLAREPNR